MKRHIKKDIKKQKDDIVILDLPSEILLNVICQVNYAYPWELIHFIELKLRIVCKTWDATIKLNMINICKLLRITPIHYCASMNLPDKIMKFNIEDKYSLRAPDYLGHSPACYAVACGAYNTTVRLKVAHALDTKYTSSEKLRNLVLLNSRKESILELIHPRPRPKLRYSNDMIVNLVYSMEFNIISRGAEFFNSNLDFRMSITLYNVMTINDSIYHKFMNYIHKNWLINSCWDILYNNKDVKLWDEYLKYNIDLNTCDENGATFLHLASSNEKLYPHLLFLLKQENINVFQRTLNKCSILDVAIFNENIKAVKILLDHGINPYSNENRNLPSVFFCTQFNKYKSFETIIDYYKDKILENIKYEKYTLLHDAIAAKSTGCLKIIMYKFEINKIHDNPSLFINHSIVNNNSEALELLIENGIKSTDDFLPIQIITMKKSYDCFRVLIKNYNKLGYRGSINDLLIMSSIMGYIDCIKILLENGVDVNFKNKQDLTALLGSVSNNKTNCAKLLLEYGADVNMTGTVVIEDIKIDEYTQKIIYYKCTPLHLSAYYNNLEIETLLQTYKADSLLKVTCTTYIKHNKDSNVLISGVELLPIEIKLSRFPIKRSYIF